jgi:hypothetical protein
MKLRIVKREYFDKAPTFHIECYSKSDGGFIAGTYFGGCNNDTFATLEDAKEGLRFFDEKYPKETVVFSRDSLNLTD